MKRIVIGGFIMLGGLLTTLTIILAAAIYAPSITQWSGKSRFWFAVFGEKQYGNETIQSLFLGFPFVIGVLLTIVGIVILGREYINTLDKSQIDDLGKKPEAIEFTDEIKRKLNELKIDQKISVVEKDFIINNYLTDENINEVYPTPFKNYFLLDLDGKAQLVVIKSNLALQVTEQHLNDKLELKKWYETIAQSNLFR